MKRKFIKVLTIGLFLYFLLPTMSLADSTTPVDNISAQFSGMSPSNKYTPVTNYIWDDAGGLLSKMNVLNSMANLVMLLDVQMENGVMSLFEFCLNPSGAFLSNQMVDVMNYLFQAVLIFKAVIFSLLPFVLAIMIAIDFTKGEYRRILNRFVQIAIAVILLFVYNDFFQNADDMKQVVNLAQDGSYLILASTTGALTVDSDLSLSDSNVAQWSAGLQSKFNSISEEMFNLYVSLPWEDGETGHTNMTLGQSYDTSGNKVSRTSDVQDDLNNKEPSKSSRFYPTPKLANPAGTSNTVDDNTKWRDVMPFYAIDTDTRNALRDTLNTDKVFSDSFSGASRFGIASIDFVSVLLLSVFYLFVSFYLLATYLMFLLGIPLGAIAILTLLIPSPFSIRVIKGWLGYMLGTILSKYIVVLIVGVTVGIIEKLLGVGGNNLDSADTFTIWKTFASSLIYTSILVLIWLLRERINPLFFMNMAMESMFSAMNGHKGNKYDPLRHLESSYRKFQHGWKDRGKENKKDKKDSDEDKNQKTDADRDNSNNNPQKPPENPDGGRDSDNLLLPPPESDEEKEKAEKEKAEREKKEKDYEIKEKEKALEGELVDEKEKQKLLEDREESKGETKQKLIASPSGKLATITYKNKPLSNVVKNGRVNARVNRQSQLAKGTYSVKTADLEDGSKIMKLNRKGKNAVDQESKKPPLLPSSQLAKGKNIRPSLKKPDDTPASKVDVDKDKEGKPKLDKNQKKEIPSLNSPKAKEVPDLMDLAMFEEKDFTKSSKTGKPLSIPNLTGKSGIAEIPSSPVPMLQDSSTKASLNENSHAPLLVKSTEGVADPRNVVGDKADLGTKPPVLAHELHQEGKTSVKVDTVPLDNASQRVQTTVETNGEQTNVSVRTNVPTLKEGAMPTGIPDTKNGTEKVLPTQLLQNATTQGVNINKVSPSVVNQSVPTEQASNRINTVIPKAEPTSIGIATPSQQNRQDMNISKVETRNGGEPSILQEMVTPKVETKGLSVDKAIPTVQASYSPQVNVSKVEPRNGEERTLPSEKLSSRQEITIPKTESNGGSAGRPTVHITKPSQESTQTERVPIVNTEPKNHSTERVDFNNFVPSKTIKEEPRELQAEKIISSNSNQLSSPLRTDISDQGVNTNDTEKGAFNVIEKPKNIDFLASGQWHIPSSKDNHPLENQVKAIPVPVNRQDSITPTSITPTALKQEEQPIYHETASKEKVYQQEPPKVNQQKFIAPNVSVFQEEQVHYQENDHKEPHYSEKPKHQQQDSTQSYEPTYQEEPIYHREIEKRHIEKNVYHEPTPSQQEQVVSQQEETNRKFEPKQPVFQAPLESSSQQNVQDQAREEVPLQQSDSQNVSQPQEIIVEMAGQRNPSSPVKVKNTPVQRQEKQVEIVLDDPFDDSFMFDDRLTHDQKMRIEEQQQNIRDAMFAQAIGFVLNKGKASQNLLRKELGMNNDVARMMIQRMEDEKIIGKREGVKGHPVLVNGKSVEELMKEQRAKATAGSSPTITVFPNEQKQQNQGVAEKRQPPRLTPATTKSAPKLTPNKPSEVAPIQLDLDK